MPASREEFEIDAKQFEDDLRALIARHGSPQNLRVYRTGNEIAFTGQVRPYNPDSKGEMDTYKEARAKGKAKK